MNLLIWLVSVEHEYGVDRYIVMAANPREALLKALEKKPGLTDITQMNVKEQAGEIL